MTVYVLDTSALIGISPGLLGGRLVTVEEVIKEAKSLELATKIEVALLSGKIQILQPSRASVARVLRAMRASGDKLSSTDIKLLALALDFQKQEAILLTDDYALQNLASRLGILYQKLREPGIKKEVQWVHECQGCGRKVSPFTSECPVCGSPVRRRKITSKNRCLSSEFKK